MFHVFMFHRIVSFDSDIPADIESFTISIYNKGKRSKDTEVGEWRSSFIKIRLLLKNCNYVNHNSEEHLMVRLLTIGM